MNSYDSTNIPCEPLAGCGSRNVGIPSQVHNIISVFLIKLFIFLEFVRFLYESKFTAAPKTTFLILNHSGRAFLSISCI